VSSRAARRGEGDEAARTSVLSPAPAAPGEIPFL
jgi:hypothetical protein